MPITLYSQDFTLYNVGYSKNDTFGLIFEYSFTIMIEFMDNIEHKGTQGFSILATGFKHSSVKGKMIR